MTATPEASPGPGEPIDLLLAADLQDHLLTATNDLDRLHGLLEDACQSLSASFFGASAQLEGLTAGMDAIDNVRSHLTQAITALQFQDMAAQLISHTHQRLRNCADRLAADAFDSDEDDGSAVVQAAPLRPNPVTQDEMDAGSVDLF